jgi:formylglycine-generating enzyme
MIRVRSAAVLGALAYLCGLAVAADRLPVGPGDFNSVLPSGTGSPAVHVDHFAIDRLPVTNAEYLAFVTAHPQWRRDRIPKLFADGDYLSQWAGAQSLGASAQPGQPVTRVSWFAARAYCEAAGGRLPSWNEWEMAAAADEQQPDARNNPQWQSRILDWYAQPGSRPLTRVGLGPPNFYGIQDLHGLVWEWVDDFNALIVSGDSRDQGDPDKLKFCGAGALSLKDRENYAILMRVAFLSSLEARSTARSLGFRCAAQAP